MTLTNIIYHTCEFYLIAECFLQASGCQSGTILPSPQGKSGNLWQDLCQDLESRRGGTCYWHLIGRGLGCAKHPTVHRTGPFALSSPNVSGAEVEKPCFRLYVHGKNKY